MDYIAEKIKLLLKEKGISQQEMADHVGMTLDGFRKMLVKNSYKLEVVLQIAEKLGYPLDYFLKEDNKKPITSFAEDLKPQYIGHPSDQIIESCQEVIDRQRNYIERLEERMDKQEERYQVQAKMIDKLHNLLLNVYSGKEPEDKSNFQNQETAESA